MEELESEGKSVSEAVEAALKRLGLRRDQVEVQILQEASSGFMGIGAKPARVRITQKHWGEPTPAGAPPPRQVERRSPHQQPRRGQPERRQNQNRPDPRSFGQPGVAPSQPKPAPAPKSEEKEPAAAPVDADKACKAAKEILNELTGLMAFADVKLAISWDAQQERVRAKLETPDAHHLIGQDGKALESFQFLATLLLSRRMGTPAAVQVDALGYWEKRENEIMSQAQRGVDEVKKTGKPWRLPPMDPAMRRLIHRGLMNNPDVETASEGEGAWRKVVIRPRRK